MNPRFYLLAWQVLLPGKGDYIKKRTNIMGLFLWGIVLVALSGCLAGHSLPPLTFEGNPREMKPGDIIETRSGEILSPEILLERLAGVQVVYVGETHTSLEDHRIQLQVLEGLYRGNRDIALALEMFPRRVQPVLDRFSEGKLGEDEFIKEVNWSEVWGFPFQLYRPLLAFARDKGLRLIGLNAPRETVNKIAREGLAALGPEDRGQIAEKFLIDDRKYREELQEEYRRHAPGNIKSFETFYEAQLAWDETMAETLVAALRVLPSGAQILVLAGKGHVLKGAGIPQAALKRMPHSSKTVIPVPVNYPFRVLSPDLADYLWVTRPFEEVHPPRLGIQVKALPDSQGLEVVEVTPGGPAAQAGFQKGDILS